MSLESLPATLFSPLKPVKDNGPYQLFKCTGDYKSTTNKCSKKS